MSTSFSFGGSTPAPSLFGGGTATGSSTPAPASFGFGSTSNAPSAPTFGFGGGFTSSAPAPPPFSFAGPAPATYGGFGGSTTAAFGSPSPAAPPAFGSFGVGAPMSSAAQMPPQPPLLLQGSMSYSALSPDMKRVIDDIHSAMMRHKRTMNHLQTMGPRLLQKPENSNTSILQTDLDKLKAKVKKISNEIVVLEKEVNDQHESDTEKLLVRTYKYALWPVEEMGVRKGIPLTKKEQEEKKDDEATTHLQSQIRMALEKSMSDVDQINRMPSPYFWQILHEYEQRIIHITKAVKILQKQIQQSNRIKSVKDIEDTIETQHLEISRLTDLVKILSEAMERLRMKYVATETADNVLERAKLESWERERKLQEKVQMALLQAVGSNSTSTTAQTTTTPAPFTSTTTASTGGLFGSSVPAPAFGGGLFGSTSAAPTNAPTGTGGLFGSSTTATTPSTGGGLFGNTTTATSANAPTASTGSFFGSSAPAPSTTTHDAFGLTTSTSSNKKKSGSKAGSRLRR